MREIRVAKVRRFRRSSTYWQLVRKSRTVLRYPSISAFWNLTKLGIGYLLRSDKAWGLPAHVKIDVSPNCNLRCPVCPHSRMSKADRAANGGEMDTARFETVIDQLKGKTLFASLYNLGEPLLNRDLFRMVRYAEENRVSTYITSNFSMKLSDERLEEFFTSKLTLLIVGIDGVSEETFGQQRVRGSWETVRDNLVRLARRKQELGSAYPFIQIQFFCYPYNAHERADVMQFATEHGIDEVSFIYGNKTPWLDALRPRPDLPAKRRSLRPACAWPYFSMLVMNDGRVLPCCKFRLDYHYGGDKSLDMGDLTGQTVGEIYASGPYRQARSMASSPARMGETDAHFCKDCGVLCRG